MTVDLSGVSAGFAEPVRAAQRMFRHVLDALSRPGTVVKLDGSVDFGAKGAIALTLLDYETPVWLGDKVGLGEQPDAAFANWLRFHCGCPLAATPTQASFVFLDATDLPALDQFNAGDAKYPDTAATLVIALPALTGGMPVSLEGPGIATRQTIAPQGLTADFWQQAAANRAQFQLGLDIILTANDAIIGLPRSTRILAEG